MAIVVVLYKAELSLFHKDLLKNGKYHSNSRGITHPVEIWI